MSDAAGTLICFGKHKGKSFRQIRAEDSGYCSWVLSLPQPNGQLRVFAAYLKHVAVLQRVPPPSAWQGRKCVWCNKPLVAIGRRRKNGKQTHDDWLKRPFHKQCFKVKMEQDLGGLC